MPLALSRFIAATSIEAGRGPPSSSLIAGSDLDCSIMPDVPQCCASRDLLSSIGVNMLLCFACAGRGFGCGIGGLANC